MFTLFHRPRIHEPVALGAVIACAITLNVVWILNLVSGRVLAVLELLTIHPAGTGSGLFVVSLLVYVISWTAIALLLRGRDCAAYRDRAYSFLVVSVVFYLIFTLPSLFTFSVGG